MGRVGLGCIVSRSAFPPPPMVYGSPCSAPGPSICTQFAAFLRSSLVFANYVQHFWSLTSYLLGICYLLDDLHSTHTPSKYHICKYIYIYYNIYIYTYIYITIYIYNISNITARSKGCLMNFKNWNSLGVPNGHPVAFMEMAHQKMITSNPKSSNPTRVATVVHLASFLARRNACVSFRVRCKMFPIKKN